MVDLLAPDGMLLLRYARRYAACMNRLRLPNQSPNLAEKARFSARAARWVMLNLANDSGVDYEELREHSHPSETELDDIRLRALGSASWGVERWAIQRAGRVKLAAHRELAGAALDRRLVDWESSAHGNQLILRASRDEANAAIITIALSRASSSVPATTANDLRLLAIASMAGHG